MSQFDGVILNPRRDNWDSSWKQSISNPKFCEQVNWELDAIENSDIIAMYFDPSTKSPITLMELGLIIGRDLIYQNLLVCCPDGFYRKGNVEILCKRNNIQLYHDYDSFIDNLTLLV